MDQIIGNVHMHVFGIDMHAAMALMPGKAQSRRKAFLNGAVIVGRQPGGVFRSKTDNEVIRLLLVGARVQGLGVGDFPDAKLIIIACPAAGRPCQQALFSCGTICVPSQTSRGLSIRACIN